MTKRILKNKPLVEAIFELRWKLQPSDQGGQVAPHYKLLIGRLYEKLKDVYPFHEQLPTASMPDEMVGGVVQHRFRTGENRWPLIQLGPGIMAVNDTEGYEAEDFESRIQAAVKAFFDVYSESDSNIEINRLLLRYIDAIILDSEEKEILPFLNEKMKTQITICKSLFEDTGVQEQPLGLDLKFAFASSKPKGVMHLVFRKGKKVNADALILETMVDSVGEDAAKMQGEIPEWVTKAHSLADDWFFKLIDGELLERFE